MPSLGETDAPRRPSIFLSYPSEDRDAARSLRDALSGYGLEVWYDEEELTGGDSWDQKIRRQIRECDFFMPVISALSESRREGYFRREWRLAVERTLDMADDHLFLLPVVSDGTEQSGARVPEKFFTVQWLRVPGGKPTAALQALAQRLISGEADRAPTPIRRTAPPVIPSAVAPTPALAPIPPPGARVLPVIPPFPNQEPGQPVKFWAHVAMWLCKAAWIQFNRLPKILRIIICLWLCWLVFFGHSSESKRAEPGARAEHAAPSASEIATKLNSAAARYEAGTAKGDAVKLGEDIARQFASELNDKSTPHTPLLVVVPFAADGANPAEQQLADSTFAMLYGKLTVSRAGKVALQAEHAGPSAAAAMQAKALENHARYLMLGGIETIDNARVLTIELMRVKNGTVSWVHHYPVLGAEADKVAAEAENHVPDLDDDDEDN